LKRTSRERKEKREELKAKKGPKAELKTRHRSEGIKKLGEICCFPAPFDNGKPASGGVGKKEHSEKKKKCRRKREIPK